MAEIGKQIVYLLTNPAMPDLVKIGMTTQAELKDRMKQLYSTGVPVPFECVFACQVKDAAEVEKVLHFAFGESRINPNREFFRIDPERVAAVLRLLKVEDVTVAVERDLESGMLESDKHSGQQLKAARRPRSNFIEMGIPVGSRLYFRDSEHFVTILDERKVVFDGKECSLTAVTRKLMGLAVDYPIQPSPYWSYEKRNLKDIYEATYSNSEE